MVFVCVHLHEKYLHMMPFAAAAFSLTLWHMISERYETMKRVTCPARPHSPSLGCRVFRQKYLPRLNTSKSYSTGIERYWNSLCNIYMLQRPVPCGSAGLVLTKQDLVTSTICGLQAMHFSPKHLQSFTGLMKMSSNIEWPEGVSSLKLHQCLSKWMGAVRMRVWSSQ